MAASISMRSTMKLNKKLSWSHLKLILNYQRIQIQLCSTKNVYHGKDSDYFGTAQKFPEFHPEDRRICFTPEEQLMKITMPPNQPDNSKILRMAIIGDPNVGKSTLINRLLQHKILPVSTKINTTRKNTLLVLTKDEYQIIFVDTPGVLNPKTKARHRVPSSLVVDPDKAADNVDLLGVVVDVKDKFRRNTLSKTVMKILHLHRNTPTVLILNKVDAVVNKKGLLNTIISLTNKELNEKKIPLWMDKRTHKLTRREQQEDFIDSVIEKYKASKTSSGQSSSKSEETCAEDTSEEQDEEQDVSSDEDLDFRKYIARLNTCPETAVQKTGWSNFKEVFMVSALKDDGVDDLRDYMFFCAKPGNWQYHSSVLTDESPYKLAENIVWEKMMDFVKFPVYELHPQIKLWRWDWETDRLDVIMNIECGNKFLVATVAKEIPIIVEKAVEELRNLFKCLVRLELMVLLKK
ncbi:GTPase Era, mitochondrial-like [Saccostrea echinata]|uniref:GTPase Era, mitochondrial-like n=1 Tax=Saccostrea echinata TaxID=191078 RepID=UPI002A841835|nr:GTPase Era, mitochondrial-like [Saccostrea echinata]